MLKVVDLMILTHKVELVVQAAKASSGFRGPRKGARAALADAAAAHQLQEENTLQGAGTLSGKIVLTP